MMHTTCTLAFAVMLGLTGVATAGEVTGVTTNYDGHEHHIYLSSDMSGRVQVGCHAPGEPGSGCAEYHAWVRMNYTVTLLPRDVAPTLPNYVESPEIQTKFENELLWEGELLHVCRQNDTAHAHARYRFTLAINPIDLGGTVGWLWQSDSLNLQPNDGGVNCKSSEADHLIERTEADEVVDEYYALRIINVPGWRRPRQTISVDTTHNASTGHGGENDSQEITSIQLRPRVGLRMLDPTDLWWP